MGKSVIKSDRSARDFSTHSSNSRPEVLILAPCLRLARMAKRARAAQARKRSRPGVSGENPASSSPTSRNRSTEPSGGMRNRNSARLALSLAGVSEKTMALERETPSSPS